MKRVQQDTTPSHADRETQSGQRMLFTGPDGIGDFRPRLDYFPRSIGIGPLSPDATSDLNYLFRPAADASPSLPKHRCTGEVGWGLQYSTALNRRTVINNKQYEPSISCAGRSNSQPIVSKHTPVTTEGRVRLPPAPPITLDGDEFHWQEMARVDGEKAFLL
ncbi:uncharacterized protein LOC125259232 [Megalobrama amblycephala]|uniref:uncharacterized protein LOC125259232 n=1 Tax=Megalobrama amblycephala TaxID=75352 RepID=UPI00201402F3|nr:uncharacterized protein LOC125259232 [Megalobrama amblycephala]